MLYTDRGKELLFDLAYELSDISEIESRPAMEGRRMIMVLMPKSKN
jgi:translation initiation factor IF-3